MPIQSVKPLTWIIWVIAALVLSPAIMLIAEFSGSSLVSPVPEIDGSIAAVLDSLGQLALPSEDAPVAAVVLFGRRIIGAGFNDVRANRNAGGHAEINALSDAIARLGIEKFKSLNRDSLSLVSTFEPCPMCIGAMLEYNIRNVSFLKAKPLGYLLLEELRRVRYQLQRRRMGPSGLQDSLFYRHPGYRKSLRAG